MANVFEISVIFFLAVLLGFNLFLFFSFRKTKRRINLLFKGKKAKSLEDLILKQITETEKQKEEIKELIKRIDNLEESAKISFQKTGIKRFNPFDSVGGNQSFVLVLLNKENNGFIVSSLYSREGNRVYAKDLRAGKSNYPLSKEEQDLISQVIKNKK